MKRKILYLLLGLAGLTIIVIVGGFWIMATKPLYQPGMVSQEEGLNAALEPPAQPAGSQTWLVEPGIELAHFAEGNGRNVLVIHGGPGLPFARPMTGLGSLTDEYQFHYYDQRGCGESTRPVESFASRNVYQNMLLLERSLGLGVQVADIERIRRILGDEKLILVGHSWGGFLASLYAAEFPDHVQALILVAPANVLVMPQEEAESDLFASVRNRLPESQRAGFDEFMAEYMDFSRLFTKTEEDLVKMNQEFGEFYVQVMGEVSHEELPEQGRPGGWMVWAQYLSMGQRHDYRPALGKVSAPVLVIHGADDLQSEAASRLYAEALPNSEFRVIEHASHFSFEQQPEIFMQMIKEFLTGLE